LALWLVASSVATLGGGVWSFSARWIAAGEGGGFAGSVSALSTGAITVMLLLGGVLADRQGQRSLLLRTTWASLGVVVVFAALYLAKVPVRELLIGQAVAAGAIAGFEAPSTGVFVRQLVEPGQVARSMSLSTTLNQTASLLGPALGGVAVAVGGLLVGLSAEGLGLLTLLAALAIVRPLDVERRPAEPLHAGIAAGLRGLIHDRLVRRLLISVALVTAAYLPLVGVLIPLVARQSGWSSPQMGAISTAWVAGSLAVSGLVAAFGPVRRVVIPMAAGLTLAAAAVGAMTVLGGMAAAAACTALAAIGISLFTSHVMPLFVLASPPHLQSRFQAVLGMAQTVPMAVGGLAFGFLSDAFGARRQLGLCAALGLVALTSLLTGPIIQARLPERGNSSLDPRTDETPSP